jgi:hypothetical protein
MLILPSLSSLITDPNIVLFCSRHYRLATVSHLTHAHDSKSRVEVMLRPTFSRPVKPQLGPKTKFLLVRQLRVCSCGAPSLKRGPVCRLTIAGPRQRSQSGVRVPRDSLTHLLSQIKTRRVRSPYLYSPGTGWPSYTPRHWIPFSPSPETRRATVEEFELASTRATDSTD